MAGADTGFDADAFRDAISFAMRMGLPETPSERALFKWPVRREYGKADSGNRPYNWHSQPLVEDTHPDVEALCAVEWTGGGGTENAVGRFERASAKITMLDTEYAKVRGANRVLLGGDLYEIHYVEPPVGLFEVTVYTLHAEAVDES